VLVLVLVLVSVFARYAAWAHPSPVSMAARDLNQKVHLPRETKEAHSGYGDNLRGVRFKFVTHIVDVELPTNGQTSPHFVITDNEGGDAFLRPFRPIRERYTRGTFRKRVRKGTNVILRRHLVKRSWRIYSGDIDAGAQLCTRGKLHVTQCSS
jgi:hypothetical protein